MAAAAVATAVVAAVVVATAVVAAAVATAVVAVATVATRGGGWAHGSGLASGGAAHAGFAHGGAAGAGFAHAGGFTHDGMRGHGDHEHGARLAGTFGTPYSPQNGLEYYGANGGFRNTFDCTELDPQEIGSDFNCWPRKARVR